MKIINGLSEEEYNKIYKLYWHEYDTGIIPNLNGTFEDYLKKYRKKKFINNLKGDEINVLYDLLNN